MPGHGCGPGTLHARRRAGAMWVEEIGLERFSQRRGAPRVGRSIRDKPIRLGGVEYPHGIGTRSISEFVIDLKGNAARFASTVGIDDEIRGDVGSVTFEVWADDVRVAASGLMRPGDAPKLLSADLRGARVLTLLVDDGGDTSNDDEVAWAGAMIELLQPDGERPAAYVPACGRAAAHRCAVDIAAACHSRRAHHGRNAGTPVPLSRSGYRRVAAAILGPWSARGTRSSTRPPASSPARSRRPARATVQLTVRGPGGAARSELRIVGGNDALALTPPMGWNSWNVWGPAVDAEKVLQAAEWLDRSGLAAHGFQYVVIDDAWSGKRGPDGQIVPNEKFPDMRALADAVHARGLKLGIYSSPGPKTCEDFAGSWQHEAQDAATFAAWGVDFLKYDWCSYEELVGDRSLAELQKPYIVMRDALRARRSGHRVCAVPVRLRRRVEVGRGGRRALCGAAAATCWTSGPISKASAFGRPGASAGRGPANGTIRTCWWSARWAGVRICARRA